MSFELFCATEYTEYHGIFLKSPILILVIQSEAKDLVYIHVNT